MVAEIVPWLQEAIAHFYPGSSYARSLSPELRERRGRGLLKLNRSFQCCATRDRFTSLANTGQY